MLETFLTFAQIILEVGLPSHVTGEKAKAQGEAASGLNNIRAGLLSPGVSVLCILRPPGRAVEGALALQPWSTVGGGGDSGLCRRTDPGPVLTLPSCFCTFCSLCSLCFPWQTPLYPGSLLA